MNISFKGPLVISKSDYPNTQPSETREIDVFAVQPTDVKIHAARKKETAGSDINLRYFITVFDKSGGVLANVNKEAKMTADEFTLQEQLFNDNDPVKEMQNKIKEIVTQSVQDDKPVDLNLNSILDRYI